MIRVHFAPRADSKFMQGRVEVDGVDISNRVGRVGFDSGPSGDTRLTLEVFVGKGGDEVEMLIPDDAVDVVAKVIVNGELIEVRPVDAAAARRLLLVGAR